MVFPKLSAHGSSDCVPGPCTAHLGLCSVFSFDPHPFRLELLPEVQESRLTATSRRRLKLVSSRAYHVRCVKDHGRPFSRLSSCFESTRQATVDVFNNSILANSGSSRSGLEGLGMSTSACLVVASRCITHHPPRVARTANDDDAVTARSRLAPREERGYG